MSFSLSDSIQGEVRWNFFQFPDVAHDGSVLHFHVGVYKLNWIICRVDESTLSLMMKCYWGSRAAKNLCGKSNRTTRARLPIVMSCTTHFSKPTVLRNTRARVAPCFQVQTTLIHSLIIWLWELTKEEEVKKNREEVLKSHLFSFLPSSFRYVLMIVHWAEKLDACFGPNLSKLSHLKKSNYINHS